MPRCPAARSGPADEGLTVTGHLACFCAAPGTTGRPHEPDMQEVFDTVPLMLGTGLRGKRRLRPADPGERCGFQVVRASAGPARTCKETCNSSFHG